MAAQVRGKLPAARGALFMILDADHSKAHVLRELAVWVPLLRRGDYLVVEDGVVNGHPLRPDFGPGPYEAIEEFCAANPKALERDTAREKKFGFTFAPRGYLIKT
jgi:cephalosporin hydroxylase